jgi:hypothetical protein
MDQLLHLPDLAVVSAQRQLVPASRDPDVVLRLDRAQVLVVLAEQRQEVGGGGKLYAPRDGRRVSQVRGPSENQDITPSGPVSAGRVAGRA